MSKIAIVQPVAKVKRAKRPLRETSPKKAIEVLVRSKVEACSEYCGKLVSSEYHPFVDAVHTAFNDHRPLVLSPDMLWLLIAQGLSRHVNANSDALRRRFVQHDGKQKLIVRRDDFLKGSPENPWSDVLGEFSGQIKEHIGAENHSNIVASFSTTGPIENAAYEVVLMRSLKSYFKYQFHSLCGIPSVTLEGTAEDWSELPKRAEVLGARYDLAWWTDHIIPTLERIARNAAGADDPQLWNNIYKIDDSSGGPYINGWIIDFFPYLEITGYIHKASGKLSEYWYENIDDFRQERIEKRNLLFSDSRRLGITTESLPGSLCTAPFLWKYLDREYEMEFVAGFIGFTQSAEDLAVRPKIGWAVREA